MTDLGDGYVTSLSQGPRRAAPPARDDTAAIGYVDERSPPGEEVAAPGDEVFAPAAGDGDSDYVDNTIRAGAQSIYGFYNDTLAVAPRGRQDAVVVTPSIEYANADEDLGYDARLAARPAKSNADHSIRVRATRKEPDAPQDDSDVSRSREGIDWNKRYLEILALPETDDILLKEKYERLGALARDFEAVASLTVRTIVDEGSLPALRKSIRAVDPTVVGGLAGGEKYIHHGIFFKMAVDWKGFYGSDEAAGKAASHELNGSARVWAANVHGLRVPLCALLRYRGVRFLAVAILPIDPLETLCWGSTDAGRTARNTDKVLSNRMKVLGKRLNLREHGAGAQEKASLIGPVDGEGHLGKDGNYYLLDLARLV
jgi:Clustered mitochondria